MIKTPLILLLFAFFTNAHSQELSDAERLASLSYIENIENLDCDNISGTTMEERHCLNLEFQRLDSILNNRCQHLLSKISTDSIKNRLIEFQDVWLENRRNQSKIASEGLESHSLGIYYLTMMNKSTELRITEIEYFIEMMCGS